MKKLIALFSSLALCGGAFTVINANAQQETQTYTYLELLEMSDAEVAGIINPDIIECGFGDETLSDEEKFKNLFPDSDIGGFLLPDGSYNWIKMCAEGTETAVMHFTVDEGVALDRTLTSQTLGFPSDWELKAFDAIKYIGGVETGITETIHEYSVYVPSEVFVDFESYIRMEEAGNQLASAGNEYSITEYSSPLTDSLLIGEYEIVEIEPEDTATNTTTTTITTITETEASDTTTTASATTTADENTSTSETTETPSGSVTSSTAKTTASSANNGSPKTGDSGMAGVILAGISAVAMAFALRKRED